jgi:hypothetical protein
MTAFTSLPKMESSDPRPGAARIADGLTDTRNKKEPGMKIYEDYTRFWTVCTVVGIAFTAYLAVTGSQLLEMIAVYVGHDNSSQKVILLCVALASSVAAAAPLYMLAKLFRINIKDKKSD